MSKRQLLAGLGGAALLAGPAEAQALMEEVAHSNTMLNGAAVSATGRVFVSFPHWTGAPTPGLGEVTAGGTIIPFPGGTWNRAGGFRSVHSCHVDRYDRLWIVDEGAPAVGPDSGGRNAARPRVVCIALADNTVRRVYALDDRAAPPGSNIGHIRTTATHAFLTDPHLGAFIVIDLETGEARRVLEGHPAFMSAKAPLLNGRIMEVNGVPFIAHLDVLELSPDETWIYFACLTGPRLYRMPSRKLTDQTLSPADVGASIEAICDVPAVSGISYAPDGSLYLSALTENAVLRVTPDRKLVTFVEDARLDSPNEGSIHDGWLYVPASQVNGMAILHDGVSQLKPPYRIFRIKLSATAD